MGLVYSGHVAYSHGIRGNSPEKAFGDTWRLGKHPGGEVSLSGTRDRCHFPKDCPAGVSAETSESGIRQGFGLVPEGLSVGLGDTCHLPKRLRKVGCFGLAAERGFRKASPVG